jgi:hypothetical protein
MTTVGLDLGHAGVVDAEHWLRLNADWLGAPPPARGASASEPRSLRAVLGSHELIACTHLVRGERPRVALSIAAAPDAAVDRLAALPAISIAVAAAAAVDHRARRSGRAVLYPGVELLTGTVPVETLLTKSAIDRVLVIGGPPVTPETPVQTRDFVRPEWRDGLLTLIVTPAGGGGVAPFEVPNPTPCCADH